MRWRHTHALREIEVVQAMPVGVHRKVLRQLLHVRLAAARGLAHVGHPRGGHTPHLFGCKNENSEALSKLKHKGKKKFDF